MRISLEIVLDDRQEVQHIGHEHEVQKNCMNVQIVSQSRNKNYPDLCCIEVSIDIIKIAATCGEDQPNDLLCVYQKDTGKVEFLTAAMIITAYYRYITKLVFPSISKDELNFFNPLCESEGCSSTARGREELCLY